MEKVMNDVKLVEGNLRQWCLSVGQIGMVQRNNQRDGVLGGYVDMTEGIQILQDGEYERFFDLNDCLELISSITRVESWASSNLAWVTQPMFLSCH